MSLLERLNLQHNVSDSSANVISTADLEIDIDERSVTYRSNLVPIKGLTFDMLAELIKADNQVVSIEDLADKVWKGKVVSDDTIAQRISLLRKALPDDSEGYIESVRSEGYRWLPSIRKHSISPSRKASLRKRGVVIVGAIIFLIAALYWTISQDQEAPIITDPEDFVEHGLDVNVFTRVKLARAQQYANALTPRSNTIAITLYRELIESDLNSPDVVFGLAKTLLNDVAKFGADSTELKEAEELSQLLLQQSSQNPQYYWLRGLYYEAYGNLTKAVNSYEQGLVLDPNDTQISLDLANLYAQKGRLFEAVELNINQFNLGQRFQLSQIANVLFLTEQNEKAENWLIASVQLAPDDPKATAKLADFLIFNNKTEEAQQLITNLHSRVRGNVESHLVAFNLSLLSGDYEKANTSLLIAERLKPNSLELIARRAWFDRLQQKVPRVSIEQFRLTEDGWPSLFVAKSILALAHDDKETALVMLSRAQRLGFINFQYLLHMRPFESLQDNRLFQEIVLTMKGKQAAERRKIIDLPIPNLGD